ncbi:MAG: hypothetical protein KC561_11430 [Myxococcales bacterium]|nr:hypothetical protein [Myxococcales bacterium]
MSTQRGAHNLLSTMNSETVQGHSPLTYQSFDVSSQCQMRVPIRTILFLKLFQLSGTNGRLEFEPARSESVNVVAQQCESRDVRPGDSRP